MRWGEFLVTTEEETYRHPIRTARQNLRFNTLAFDETARDSGDIPVRTVSHRAQAVGVFFGEVDAHGEALFQFRGHGVTS